MTEDQIKHMADRFLGWRLPENFNPDCGISFKRTHSEQSQWGPQKYEPIGTNLFDATQATAMVRHMVEGLPPASTDYVPTYADGIESALKIVDAAMGDGSSGEDIREICDARLAVVRSKLIDELSYANLRASGGLPAAGG